MGWISCGVFCLAERRPHKGVMRESPKNIASARRILVVRLDEIGDVILTSPFLRELRRFVPKAWITLAVKTQLINLVERCPHVDEVVACDWPRSIDPVNKVWCHLRAFILAHERLKPKYFDVAIVPRWDMDRYHAGCLAKLSGAPVRVGYAEQVNASKQQRNQGFNRFYTHVLDERTIAHEVERGLQLLRWLGADVREDHLELWTDDQDQQKASKLLNIHGVVSGDLLVAFALGSGSDSKRRWPVERYAAVAQRLHSAHGARIVVIGGEDDRQLGDCLRAQVGLSVINAAGCLSLRQTAALLAGCNFFLGNDTGPKHLAAAVGIPVIEISCHPRNGFIGHAHSPCRFHAWRVWHRELQPATGRNGCVDSCQASVAHCILDVPIEEVFQAIEIELRQKPSEIGNGSMSKALRV